MWEWEIFFFGFPIVGDSSAVRTGNTFSISHNNEMFITGCLFHLHPFQIQTIWLRFEGQEARLTIPGNSTIDELKSMVIARRLFPLPEYDPPLGNSDMYIYHR